MYSGRASVRACPSCQYVNGGQSGGDLLLGKRDKRQLPPLAMKHDCHSKILKEFSGMVLDSLYLI